MSFTQCRVAHLIYSQKVGGSEIVAANICSNIDRNIFDPMILFFFKSQGSMPEILSGIDVPCHNLNLHRYNIPIRPFLIASTLNRLKIDILHVHHVPLYKRAANGIRLSRVKGVVVTEHAKFSISKSPKLQSACRKTARTVDHFTVVSKNLKKYFVEQVHLPKRAIHVIHNGIDTHRFSPKKADGTLSRLLPDTDSKKIILNVGRFADAKDHLTLLSAMEKVLRKRHDLALVLVGDGELRPTIEQKIKDLKIARHVHLLGSRSDVDKLMTDADIFVLSSKREGLPMVVMEAMATGLPVIATEVGGIGEVVHNDSNGTLIPAKNDTRLAEAIETMLDNPERARDMGQSARNLIIDQYSLDKISGQYAELYNSI